MKESEVIIIGGGVIGLFAAYFLNEKKYAVTILDSGLIPGQQASSFGNAGMVVPSHFLPLATRAKLTEGLKSVFSSNTSIGLSLKANKDYFNWLLQFYKSTSPRSIQEKSELLAALSLESRELFLQLQDHLKIPLFLNFSGIQMVCKSSKTLNHEIQLAAEAIKLGMDTEIWNDTEFAQKNPGLDPRIRGAVYYPKDGVLDPFPMQKSLVDLLSSRGVNFVSETKVSRLETENGTIKALYAGDKKFLAKTFVIAAGYQSNNIARMLDLNLPVLPGKGISYQVRKSGHAPAFPTLLQDSHIAITPYENHLRVSSQFKLGNESQKLALTDLLGIHAAIKENFAAWDMPRPKKQFAWTGFRPVSPDGLPLIGFSSIYSNLLVATGHAMIGLSLAPVSGKIVENMISNDQKTQLSVLKLLNPSRFKNRF